MEALPIPTDTYKLGFIGAGKMAESIARGIVRSGVLPPNRISTFHRDPSRRQAFESFGVHLLSENDDVVEESDVVIFSVKPQVVKDVVSQLRPLLSRKKLLVSIAAGVKLKDLQDWAGHSRFIRVMPNTPSAVGAASSVLSLGGGATEQDGDLIAKVFGSIGKTWKADEKYFDAVTGLRRLTRTQLWDKYSAYEHWAKIEVPKDKDELTALQDRLRKRFPVDAYNKARRELDTNRILSNNKLEKLFPLSDTV